MTLPVSPSLNIARAEVAAQIKAAADEWQIIAGYTMPVEAENRAMTNLASAQALNPFIAWEMKFRSGIQASLGLQPLMRQYGQIFISAKVKEGQGTAVSLQLLSHVIPYIEMRDLGVTHVEAAEVMDGFARQGWYFIPVLINFWIDRISDPSTPTADIPDVEAEDLIIEGGADA